MSDLLALAERCEAATGPDRELDVLIAVAVEAVDPRTKYNESGGFGYVDRNQWAVSNVPRYTASLDAAMTLVPEGDGRWPQIEYTSPNPNNIQQAHRVAIWQKGCKPVRGHSPFSFALALTAAALRARAASAPSLNAEIAGMGQ